MRSTVLLLAIAVYGYAQLLQSSYGQQLQCGELDVENSGQAMSGSGLSICSNDSLQCCLQSHIDAVTDVARNRLSLGLRLQMRETSLRFNATINSIKSYFTTSFRNSWIGALPSLNNQVQFSQLEGIAGPAIDGFIMEIQNANVTAVIDNIIAAFARSAAAHFGNASSNESVNCIRNVILSNVNQTDVSVLVRGLTMVQNAVKVFEMFSSFLYRYRMNTNFTFPGDCVRRFVELNFCARCTRRSPPLCSNTCGALFRGCLSPYYTVLNRQFDLIWNVSGQVLRITNNTLQTLFTNERNLFDASALAQLSNCGVMLPGAMGKRQAQPNTRAMFIPQDRMMELRNLTGRGIAYDDDRPLICRPTENEMQFCANNTQRRQGNYCGARSDCTSMCRCYDGMRDRMDNTEEFDGNGIDGQMNNPAIDLTDSDLRMIVDAIGTPAQSFLMRADITAVLPEGVTVPQAESTTTPPPGGASSMTFQLSLMVLPLGAIVAAYF